MKVSKELDVKDFKLADVEKAHRLPAQKRDKKENEYGQGMKKTEPCKQDIIIQFKTREARDMWLTKKKERKNLTNGKILGTSSKDKVYVNEHLTNSNKRLLWLAKNKARAAEWKFVWFANGKILARKKEGQKAIWIRDEKDVERLENN